MVVTCMGHPWVHKLLLGIIYVFAALSFRAFNCVAPRGFRNEGAITCLDLSECLHCQCPAVVYLALGHTLRVKLLMT